MELAATLTAQVKTGARTCGVHGIPTRLPGSFVLPGGLGGFDWRGPYYTQRLHEDISLLRLQVRALDFTPERSQDPEEDPPISGGQPWSSRRKPEAEAKVLVGVDQRGQLSLGQLFTLLLIVLAGLITLGWLIFGRQCPKALTEGSSSPLQKRDLAQRQLAELRLRRHGFGQ